MNLPELEMNEDNTQMLYTAFPDLYRDQRGFYCGNGWAALINDLSAKIEAEARRQGLVPTSNAWPLAVRVDELNGTLRFHLSTSSADDLTGLTRPVVGPEYQKLIAEAENKSTTICERCGQPGTLLTEDYQHTSCQFCEEIRKIMLDEEKEFEESEYLAVEHDLRLYILSDLHLEQADFRPYRTLADVIVLPGDIGHAAEGVLWARNTFPDQEIIYVPGNHEFYGWRREDRLAEMRKVARATGVHLLDNDEVVISGVRFLGSTLWTDFRCFGADVMADAMVEAQQRLNDFRLIAEESTKGKFTPARSIELHEQSLAWLSGKLEEPFDGKTVVVTHHLPSMKSVAEKYQYDLLTACFASDLDFLFGKMELWIHGHTHSSSDYEVRGTRVICNPRGYERNNHSVENFEFKPALVVAVTSDD
jgi:predicted phosphodiesterase